jgi:hypothetical protein
MATTKTVGNFNGDRCSGCIATATYDVMLESLGSSDLLLFYQVQIIAFILALDPIQFTSTITGNYTTVVWDFGDGTFQRNQSDSLPI